MSFVLSYIACSTGADEGHRFAAFSTPRSFGMTNCSRTFSQKASFGAAGACAGSGAALAQAKSDCASQGIEPPTARSRAKSLRVIPLCFFMDAPLRAFALRAFVWAAGSRRGVAQPAGHVPFHRRHGAIDLVVRVEEMG